MATLLEQLQKAKKINANKLNEDLFDIVKFLEKEIIKINTKDQLFKKGVDANNKPLFSKQYKRGTYSLLTQELSGGIKQAGDHYTLDDTGDFFKGFFIEIQNDKALFGSTDSKTPLLIADFGEIFGLTDKNLRAVVRNKLLPLFITQIRKQLDL